jgi:transcriptional regulator with XRE-family HTH domain
MAYAYSVDMARPKPSPSGTDRDIREVFRAEMDKSGLTYRTLAERMGLTPASVYQILEADRGLIPKSLLDVADELGVEIVAKRKGRKRSD